MVLVAETCTPSLSFRTSNPYEFIPFPFLLFYNFGDEEIKSRPLKPVGHHKTSQPLSAKNELQFHCGDRVVLRPNRLFYGCRN
ncbi:hypothetical protein LINPERHAP1_LOCUS17778 [Linum perenne]